MALTTDPKDPRLNKPGKDGMDEVYLVLSEEERAKGFIRPFRNKYIHAGERPTHELRDLTEKEYTLYNDVGYIKFEQYPDDSSAIGRFWTQKQLDSGCGSETKMGDALSETYAVNPKFYGATFCTNCSKHFPVKEFTWSADGKVVGS